MRGLECNFLQWRGGRWKSKKSLKVSRLVKLEFRLSQRPATNAYFKDISCVESQHIIIRFILTVC